MLVTENFAYQKMIKLHNVLLCLLWQVLIINTCIYEKFVFKQKRMKDSNDQLALVEMLKNVEKSSLIVPYYCIIRIG